MTQNETHSHQQLVASVIAAAREDFIQSATGRTVAQFDYEYAGRTDAAQRSMSNALYDIATRDFTGTADEREQCWHRLTADLAADLDAFRAKCAKREYTGWSKLSTGPVRYAK